MVIVRSTGRARALHHVQLAMPEGGEVEAVRFYAELLGVAQVPKPPELAARGGCWFEDGDLRIHLGVEEPFQAARKAHAALLVDDLDALLEKLVDEGIEIVAADPLEGRARVYVDDPFGNRLELLDGS